jgi:hypothetical protein
VQVLSRYCRPTRWNLKCSYHTSTFLSQIHYLISYLHRAWQFEITLYLSSHFSYSSAAFRKIAQAGGGGQGQGELWFHEITLCVYLISFLLLVCCFP